MQRIIKGKIAANMEQTFQDPKKMIDFYNQFKGEWDYVRITVNEPIKKPLVEDYVN